MKCKACNADVEVRYRVVKETGQLVMEDLCSVCRRYVFSRYTLDDPDRDIASFLGTRRHGIHTEE